MTMVEKMLAVLTRSWPQCMYLVALILLAVPPLFMAADGGAVSDKYTYAAWANETSNTGSAAQPSQHLGLFGYCAQFQDANQTAYQAGMRLYGPGTGTSIRVGAANDGIDHCDSPPTTKVGPSGRKTTDVSRDPALRKCLQRIKGCMPQLAAAIDRVDNGGFWQCVDAEDYCADVTWKLLADPSYANAVPVALCKPQTMKMAPVVTFSTSPEAGTWAYRYGSPDEWATFCQTVLHELIHVSHGFWRSTYCDAYIETWRDASYFERQAECMWPALDRWSMPRVSPNVKPLVVLSKTTSAARHW